MSLRRRSGFSALSRRSGVEDTTFVLGELTCPSTLQYCYSFCSLSLPMSGWRLSAGDLDSPHCLGEVEWRRLVDATFVLGELTCPSTLQLIP